MQVRCNSALGTNEHKSLSKAVCYVEGFCGVMAVWRVHARYTGDKKESPVPFSFFSSFMLYYFSIFYFFRSVSPITLSSSLLSIFYSSTIVSLNLILLLSLHIYIIFLQVLYPFLPLLTRRRVRLGLESTEEVVNCRSINNTAHFSICDWLLYAWRCHHCRMLLREVTQNILFLWKKRHRILCGQQIDVRACLL